MPRSRESCSCIPRTLDFGVLSFIRRAVGMSAVGLLLLTQSASAMFQEESSERFDSCTVLHVERAAEGLPCVELAQIRQLAAFQGMLSIMSSAPDEYPLRNALVLASKTAACVNDYRMFPTSPSERADFHCLQRQLIDFYQETRKWVADEELHFQDLSAHASTRIHFCMIDEDLPALECLAMMETALEDYQRVFQQLENPTVSRGAQPESAGYHPSEPASPGLPELERFVALSLENSWRFPTLVGQQFGSVLGPALCGAYAAFPEARERLSFLYNVLIRFDFANMASTSRLYAFFERLEDGFRIGEGTPSYLRLDPPDWSPSGIPCGEEEWQLVFPRLVLDPGFRLPSTEELRGRLDELHLQLVETASFAGERTHLWKPFHRYGQLLVDLADSLRRSSLRSPELQSRRHLLMQEARDAFLLKGVESGKYPKETEVLHAPITQQIDGYGRELLNGLYLQELIGFAEEYLEQGESLLSEGQKAKLHRLLAISYRLTGDRQNALSNLQESDLEPLELEQVVEEYREVGFVVPSLDLPPESSE